MTKPLHSRCSWNVRALAVATALAMTLLWSGAAVRPAYAADAAEAQAKEMFRQAEVHFNLREFDRALELYTEAYRKKPLPGFLFNIAQCHRFSERYEDAAFSFRVYLQRAPGAANRAEVEELIAQMEAKAAASAGEAPTTAPAVTPPAADEPPPVETPEPAAPAPVPQPAAPVAEPQRTVSPWVWTTAGIGGAFLVAGLVTGQMASNRSNRLVNNPPEIEEERDDLRSSGRTLVAASIVTLSAGGAALATAAVLWWVGRAPAAGDAGTQVSVAPTSGGAVVGVSGGF